MKANEADRDLTVRSNGLMTAGLVLLVVLVAAADSNAQLEPLPGIPVTDGAVGMAVDPAIGLGWVLGSGGALQEFDVRTGLPTRLVTLGAGAYRGVELQPAGTVLAAVDESTSELLLIDREGLTLLHRVALPTAGGHVRAYFDPDGRTVRVRAGGGGIADTIVVDAASGDIVSQSRILYGMPEDLDVFSADATVRFTTQQLIFGDGWFTQSRPGSPSVRVDVIEAMRPAFDAHSGVAWLVDRRMNEVRRIDLHDGAVSSIDSVAAPTAVAWAERQGIVVVAAGNRVRLYDAVTDELVGDVFAGGLSRADIHGVSPLAVASDAGLALVARSSTDAVHVIDIDPDSPTFATVLASPQVEGCAGDCDASGVLVSADGAHAFVLTESGTMVGRFALPRAPVSIFLAPKPSGAVLERGGVARMTAIVTNNSGAPVSFSGRIDVWFPDGTPYAGNPVAGPQEVVLRPGRIVRRTIRVPVRDGAPGGAFRVVGRLDDVDGLVSSSDQRFFVDP